MSSLLRRFLTRLGGTAAIPEDFAGRLTGDERVLAVARSGDGPLVATHLGLWVPETGGARRIGWHLLSKATWSDDQLQVIEAEESGSAGEAVLLRDLPPRRFALRSPGRLPEAVHARVTGSIRSSHHRDLPGGGAWFVQRKIPGLDGVVLQVRADEGAEREPLMEFARTVAEQLRQAKEAGG